MNSYLILVKLWFQDLALTLSARPKPVSLWLDWKEALKERSRPVMMSTTDDIDAPTRPSERSTDGSTTSETARPVTASTLTVPPGGATEDWSPIDTMAGVNDFVEEIRSMGGMDEVDQDAAYLEYLHHELLAIEHAVLTDFNVAVNRALYKFGMTQKEMLGAAVLHEGSGEHELVSS